MAKLTKELLLEELRNQKKSCVLEDAENALREWGFILGRTKGHARVWNYKHVTLTLHVPHKRGKSMDPGAVAMVLKKIAEAALVQEQEGKAKKDVNQTS